MNRTKLIKELNILLALIIFSFNWLFVTGLNDKDFKLHSYDTYFVPSILLVAYLTGRLANWLWVQKVASKRPYLGAFFFILFYGWISMSYEQGFFACLNYFAGNPKGTFFVNIMVIIFALPMWGIYFWFVYVAVLLVATPAAGFLFNYLYTRRDYLPEEK